MAELDERLDQLLSDPEGMRKVLDAARAVLAQREGAAPTEASALPESAPPASADGSAGVAAMLSSLLGSGSTSSQSSAPLSAAAGDASPLTSMLPQLMTLFSGQGDLVKSERLELLRAMKPYLKASRISSIDRAVKMANMTKAATSAMHLLGR